MDNITRLANVLNSENTVIKIPGVGKRVVKNVDGRLVDQAGKDVTDAILPKPPEPPKPIVEDGKRVELSELAQSSIPDINSVLLKGNETLKAFKAMKEFIVNDIDTDAQSIEQLNAIEQILNKFMGDYLNKKEKFRAKYSLDNLQ